MAKPWWWATAMLFVASPVFADDAADARIRALEGRVKELEARVPPAPPPTSTPPTPSTPVETGTKAHVTLSGYVETFYQWNFNNPSNFITNYRGFDNRHNIFSVENVVLDASASVERVSARLALQVGGAPEAYYASEPVWKATNGVGPSGPDVWKLIQQANVGYVVPVGNGLDVEGGIFLSPIGPESLAIKDTWNWSRSNLFFGLPFYHTGVRASYPVTDKITVSLHVYNGWNSVVDNNIQLSVAGQFLYATPAVTWSAIYFGGVERPQNAPEGAPWRNLFDSYLVLHPRKWFAASFHFDTGFEPNNFGTSGWMAGAATLRFHPLSWLYLAARTDAFYEWIAENGAGSATPIFWSGSHWISSQTATIDVRPNSNMSVRLEYRHDESERPLFFQGQVPTDANGNFVANARGQDTMTLGATAWF